MKNRAISLLVLFAISITTLWILCPAAVLKPADGHLPSFGNNSGAMPTPPPAPELQQTDLQASAPPPYRYSALAEKREDFSLAMHVLEIDTSDPRYCVKPVLSHETLFGYAFLSDMDKKWQAIASVNGGFSHPTGRPGGLFYEGGELKTFLSGRYPVLFMSRGKAYLSDAKGEVWLEGEYPEGPSGRQTGAEPIRLDSLYYNEFPQGEGLYVFTPAYGSRNRIEREHLNAVYEQDEVRGLIKWRSSYDIPPKGLLISAIGPYSENRLEKALAPGMKLKVRYKIESEKSPGTDFDWAYECGSWIVRNKKAVAPDWDAWVGNLNVRTPRTAVGIKENGNLVFFVADGRQKGLSDGLTGQELAQRLIAQGVVDAAFLDGGASSEMILEGRIVNSPSAGRERMLASAFVLIKK